MTDYIKYKIPEQALLAIEAARLICLDLGVKLLAVTSVDFTVPDPNDDTKTTQLFDTDVVHTNVTTLDIAKMLFIT